MEGGDLLATGSSSCIFRPSLPCRGSNKKPSKGLVSKIVYGSKSDRYYDKEKLMAKLIKSISGYKKWCIIYDNFCLPPVYDNIFKYDKTILECKDRSYDDIFDETSKMMVGKYGGETFEDYFIEHTLFDRKSKPFEKNMYKLLLKMKQLFIGLKEIYHNKLIHLDIKYNNIVLDGSQFKYIDFGLSGELSDLTHFENRSLSEFEPKKRVYIWYPYEYLYAFIDPYEKVNELDKFNSSSNYRKHYKDTVDVHHLFDVNVNSHIKELLSSNKDYTDKEYRELISMIDVYGLGIIIPFLFVEYELTKHIDKSLFLTDLFKLFKSMCKVDHKQRMNPDDCLKGYNKLVKKYSHLTKSKKGKKTKRKLK